MGNNISKKEAKVVKKDEQINIINQLDYASK